ncbi:MAG: radical SAM protein, partial [Calditerricola sp.]|nr:radical SAM protein [Calditerricola sp.]
MPTTTTATITDPRLVPIAEKVERGERLTKEDGLALYESPDLLTIGRLADMVNRRKNGDRVYFIENMYINPTNVCEAHCRFCAFRRDPGEDGAYTMSPEEVLEYVAARFNPNIREFHIVGGHNHTVPFDYYLDVIQALKRHYPQVTIKAYTA